MPKDKQQPTEQDTQEKPQPRLERFFFPEYGVTVEAENLQQATQLVRAQQKGAVQDTD